MSASISTHAIPGGTWLVAQGPREEVFTALGEEARESIRDVVASSTGLSDLQERISVSNVAAQRYEAVAEESRSCYPDIWSELEHLASGAGVAFHDLLLLNLRPDLGTDDGTGCTDMAWTGSSSSLLAHNEDGHPGNFGRCPLVTLLIDQQPAVTSWWYPGHIPANAYSFNEHGLCWGIDNINVNQPAVAPGRNFVARSLQGTGDLETFIKTLQTSPSAGGFAYTVGSMRSEQAAVVETAAGSVIVRPLNARTTDCVWHTNHLRMLDSVPGKVSDDSLARADRLSELPMPTQPERDWMFRLFSADPVIGGIRTETATLSTVLYDLTAGEIVLKIGDGRPIVIPGNQPTLGQPAYELLDVGVESR